MRPAKGDQGRQTGRVRGDDQAHGGHQTCGHERTGEHGGGLGHSHGVGLARAADRNRRPLVLALGLIVGSLVVQLVTALAAGSLALLSDAGHLATDALGLGMALAAMSAAARGAGHPQRTFGLYRLEILAALANAVLLVGVGVFVVVEAFRRLDHPPQVGTTAVLAVGVLGLVANVAALLLLRSAGDENLNMRGAQLEVLADTLGSLGVIAAAIVLAVTGWAWVDPLIGAAIGVFILPRALRLGADALRVLVQAAPRHLDVAALRSDLSAIPGVVDVHDLHVWTLTSEMDVASAHLMVRSGTDAHGVLDQARHLLAVRYRLDHATLQVEPDDHTGCEQLRW